MQATHFLFSSLRDCFTPVPLSLDCDLSRISPPNLVAELPAVLGTPGGFRGMMFGKSPFLLSLWQNYQLFFLFALVPSLRILYF